MPLPLEIKGVHRHHGHHHLTDKTLERDISSKDQGWYSSLSGYVPQRLMAGSALGTHTPDEVDWSLDNILDSQRRRKPGWLLL